MTRLNIVLAVALLASALLLVHTAYDARRLYSALDRAQQEQHALAAEAQRLDAERQAQATNARVERVAREKLQMRTASPAVTQYVTDSGAAPSAPPSPSGDAGVAALGAAGAAQ